MLIGVLCLIASVGFYSISQLLNHGKFRFSKINNYIRGFWDSDSYLRKYKLTEIGTVIPVSQNWYYKYIARVKYKERWFTSTNLTVAFTDGYHACQSLSFIFLAASLASFSGINFFFFWPAITALHALGYRIFQR